MKKNILFPKQYIKYEYNISNNEIELLLKLIQNNNGLNFYQLYVLKQDSRHFLKKTAYKMSMLNITNKLFKKQYIDRIMYNRLKKYI